MGFDDEQLTLTQAAELLGLSPSTLTMQARKGTLVAHKIGKTYVTTRAEIERYRRDHLGRVGRPSKPAGLEGLLAAIGQDLDAAEGEALDLRPMEPPVPKPRQDRLPIDAPKPEFGQPIDAPRPRKRPAGGVSSAPVDEDAVGDYRHSEATRTNIPEAGLATQDRTPTQRVTYAYDPHLDPQLVWAGKAEHTSFDVDTVSLHIHERASTAAILRAVRREEVQRTLFSDPVMSVTPFLTVKPCVPTLKSHLSKAVVDSGWERQVARALDESSRVHAWVKNAKLSFTIPYEHQGRRHDFIPDFVVMLRDVAGRPSHDHVVVEVKGLEREADRSKDVGAARWIAAVNHWSKLGRWRYAKIHSPHDLISILGADPGPT